MLRRNDRLQMFGVGGLTPGRGFGRLDQIYALIEVLARR